MALQAKGNLELFLQYLDNTMELVAEQLYHRYQIQPRLKAKDMPFLMGQGLYLDSENFGSEDPIEQAIKHGTLAIGFIGYTGRKTFRTFC